MGPGQHSKIFTKNAWVQTKDEYPLCLIWSKITPADNLHLNLNNFWRTKALRRIIKATERWMRSPYWISLTKICYNPTTVQFLYCTLTILAPAYLGGRRKANRSPYWSPNWISLTKICYNLLHPATTVQFLNSLNRQDFKNIWSERFRMEENRQKKNYRPCDHHLCSCPLFLLFGVVVDVFSLCSNAAC